MFHIGQRKFLRVKKVKNTVPRTYVTGNLKAKEIVATFYEKELRKKWKGQDSSFNSWIDKKEMV